MSNAPCSAGHEKESAMTFTLMDFGVLVQAYGAHEVMSKMDEQTFWHLYKWFKENFEMDVRREL